MNRLSTTCFVGLLAAAVIAPAVAADSGSNRYRELLEARSDAIVTVKAVLRTEVRMMGQAQEEESRTEVPGVMVDPGGIVLVSNMPFSATRMKQMTAGRMPGGLDIDITPIDLKVLFDGDETEYDAFIVATDTEFDLAFLQIEDLGDREVSVVDFDETSRAGIGDEIFTVTRMGRGYDYAAHVQSARIGGEIRRPRRAWIVDRPVDALGLPVFSADGQVIGVLTTLASGTVDDPDAGPGGMRGMMRMMGGGGATDAFDTFALPARNVRTLLISARERAAEMLEEREQEEIPDEAEE